MKKSLKDMSFEELLAYEKQLNEEKKQLDLENQKLDELVNFLENKLVEENKKPSLWYKIRSFFK